MKLTLSWLKEYLDTEASLDQICSNLTDIGLEVESVEDKSKTLSNFVVAQIIEAKACENSNKLKICQVAVPNQTELLQIICGASNARSGIKVAYAPIGSVIPSNGMVIKKAKIAGVESNGMLCSARELCIGEEDSGIIEIDDKWAIGEKIIDVFGLNDALIEINITPNRGDCLGIFGIASDLSAKGVGKLKNIEIAKIPATYDLPITIKNDAQDDCSYAAFRHIKNIKNCESPKWLKDKLQSLGINSISAIVDITNYVMMVLNRPMHAYDANKINEFLEIRRAQNAEKFTSLKNDEFVLDESDLVIADKNKILGIAGIIGSNNSSCGLETTEILLEAAFFQAATIAKTGRKLNVLTDSRYRFERSVDENTCETGIDLATSLIIDICGGKASQTKIIGQKLPLKKIEFDIGQIKKRTNVEIDKKGVIDILTKLNFLCEELAENKLLCTVPSNRHDILIAEDLVEEVIRIYGYDKIKEEKFDDFAVENQSNDLAAKIRLSLASKGMIEAITWSFIDLEMANLFAKAQEQLTLANPISSDLAHMRPTLLHGLVASYQKNSLRNFKNLSFFEIGNVFFDETINGQKLMVSGLRAGKNKEQNHYHDERDFDVFDVKKDFLDAIDLCGIRAESLQISQNELPKYYHPHRSACVKLGKNLIGYFGELHPKISKKFDLKISLNVFEVFIENLPNSSKSNLRKSFVVNDFPVVERDFAFLFESDKAIGDIIKTVMSCDKSLIKQVEIFDIYSGKNLQENKKSVAFRVFIQSAEKTLSSEEIENLSQKIIDTVSQQFNAILRGATTSC